MRLSGKLILISLLLLGGFLRFYNLGYSEFQNDEKKAIIRKDSTTSTFEFLMNQRKGSLQFLVTSTVLSINNDPGNELALRTPFAFFSLISIIVFYLILREFIKSELISFIGSFIFLANGFMVGFSRIAQYQNLNILFSLLSLLFFIKLSKTKGKEYLFALLGTLFFALSLLSHWDAVFFLIPIVYFYFKFLQRDDIDKEQKTKITRKCVLTGSILLLPFLIPYIFTLLQNQGNLTYFNRRVGWSDYSLIKHRFIFELYNPFVTLYFLTALVVISLLKFRRFFIFFVWFFINFLTIRFLMEKPGTHIYNYVLPIIFLSTFGLSYLYNYKKVFYAVFFVPLIIICSYLYFQSYVIFIDNTREYPWEEKGILNIGNIHFVTEKYEKKEVLTFGFPHFRNWKKVGEIIDNDPEDCNYITNEGKEISQIYVLTKYGILADNDCYYIVDVKRPFITAGNGAVFAKTVGKKPVYVYKRNGEKLVKVYKIKQK